MDKIKKLGFLIGRLIVGLLYIFFGLRLFINFKTMVQLTAQKLSIFPEFGVFIAGVLLIVGGFTILTGFMPWLGVFSLAVFYIPVTFIMHDFWNYHDPQMKTQEIIHFLLNMTLMGSSLMFLAIPEPWTFSLSRRSRK
ncbi:hypothetical protein HRbin19_01737 [bacterium HR19]|nr:hypothetical protein HRbin19_01737 [bacterium HR19]